MAATTTGQDLICYHCGDICSDSSIAVGDKIFCCNGCRMVFELLSANDLDYYYNLDKNPGSPIGRKIDNKYAYLDIPEIKNKLVDFSSEKISRITLSVPSIHCSSCIWLLENLNSLKKGVVDSKVDFMKKEVTIQFYESEISLRILIELMVSIGYEPDISLKDLDKKAPPEKNHSYSIKMAVAGFCFANIMLFSFPEYLVSDGVIGPDLKKFFGYLNIFLSLPVFFYSAIDYYKSAFKSLRYGVINIDVPITLGIFILFTRSLYEIISHTGIGYMDSMSGLVFFLLIGKYFQQKTYDSLSFDRDYKSYFPISVTKLTEKGEEYLSVKGIKTGDRILVRNQELIPADSQLLCGDALVDYSFVTGESDPVAVQPKEMLFAGGRQVGTAIELEVVKDVSRSYLTRLWNDQSDKTEKGSQFQTISNRVSKYFTIGVLALAMGTGIFWYIANPEIAINAVTAVLIIACPCALALSIPFSFGTAQRILGKNKLYLKNSLILETVTKISDIVFDKTGTLTKANHSNLKYSGEELSLYQKELVASLVRNSTHPISVKLFNYLSVKPIHNVTDFKEVVGMGTEGIVEGYKIKIGSGKWLDVNADPKMEANNKTTRVYISFDDKILGYYSIENLYRSDLSELINKIPQKYALSVLSGDNENETDRLNEIFKHRAKLIFNQSPHDKLEHISALQKNGKKVIMFGDGLNDARALRQSNIGIAVTENVNSFSPASDAILDGSNFNIINKFISLSDRTKKVVMMSFAISILYNVIGMTFAVQGLLEPIYAAILMPLSSISVVLFTTLSVKFSARKLGL